MKKEMQEVGSEIIKKQNHLTALNRRFVILQIDKQQGISRFVRCLKVAKNLFNDFETIINSNQV